MKILFKEDGLGFYERYREAMEDLGLAWGDREKMMIIITEDRITFGDGIKEIHFLFIEKDDP